jgi:hypothetical protein
MPQTRLAELREAEIAYWPSIPRLPLNVATD